MLKRNYVTMKIWVIELKTRLSTTFRLPREYDHSTRTNETRKEFRSLIFYTHSEFNQNAFYRHYTLIFQKKLNICILI